MAEATDPDSALMLRVKQGDRDAFQAIVEKYKQPVFTLICRTLNDPDEAEDLAQNVFIQAYRAAPRYQPSAKLATWLFTIARNLCLNEIRRRSRHPAESLDVPRPDSEAEPKQWPDPRELGADALALRHELEQRVEEAVAALPETQRTALLMFRDQDLSYEDISEVLGCSLSATKSIIHRARETLKARLKPYLRSGAWNSEPPRQKL